jgi:hypothetical protein
VSIIGNLNNLHEIKTLKIHSYETSDGQSREEVGFFRDDPKLGKVLTVHGSYGYIAPNKKKIFVKYVADEKGYRSTMSNYPPVHLPSNVINQQLGFLKN